MIGQLSDSELKEALKDLKPRNGRLSVFVVDDDKSNLERTVAALATTNTRSPDDAEFFLLDVKEIDSLGMTLEETKANTADETVNFAHRNLVVSEKRQLEKLAQALVSKGEADIILEKKIIWLICEGIKSGEIDPDEIKIVPHSRFWPKMRALGC
ncbi:MAG: hypothetical protein OXF44_14145 [Anaerolineaceae bacterium]|nr:hypothetical protein [Anaerolineaceae bacterium]